MTKFKVGDRVYLTDIVEVWAEVKGQGTVTGVTTAGYTVEFGRSGTIGGLQDNELELAEETRSEA